VCIVIGVVFMSDKARREENERDRERFIKQGLWSDPIKSGETH
jgi:hypothetical protein